MLHQGRITASNNGIKSASLKYFSGDIIYLFRCCFRRVYIHRQTLVYFERDIMFCWNLMTRNWNLICIHMSKQQK